MKKLISMALVSLLVLQARAEAPHIDPKDDRKHFGNPDSILFWTAEQKVAGFRNQNLIFPIRPVPRGKHVLALPYKLEALGSSSFEVDNLKMTVDNYFQNHNVAGLLVIKDGVIRYERYGLGNTDQTRWVSFSVTKSVTSMLVGAAIADGYIESVDEKVTDYLPRLKGSAYEGVTIRNILQMNSGIEWNETYSDPSADINTVNWQTLALYKHLGNKKRMAPPGTTFNYSTAETNLVGNLLRAAIGNNLSTYLSDKIWRPFGMEHNAYWELSGAGDGEFGGCCLNATLRDYGRLGLFALENGKLSNSEQVLPIDWMAESTNPSTANREYGYLWWLTPQGTYEASGIFGQAIYVDPKKNVVIAQHSARQHADKDSDWAIQAVAFRSLAEAVSD